MQNKKHKMTNRWPINFPKIKMSYDIIRTSVVMLISPNNISFITFRFIYCQVSVVRFMNERYCL